MCAYNAYEVQPCCASDKLMLDILRNDWNFTGYVTSDCGAIDDFYRNHQTHPDAPHAAADAVFHGTDLDCGRDAYLGLLQAVADNLITEKDIDISLKRLFTIRFRLGMFDPQDKVPFSKIDSTFLERKEHKELALKMARQSIVMLRNENDLLPIDKQNLKKIAILGPNANNPEVQLGNYNGFPTRIITVLDGIREELGDEVEIYTDTVIGYYGSTPSSFEATLENIQDADLIIYAGGISPRIEGEEMPHLTVEGFYKGDRTSILLPQIQRDFMQVLKTTDKPIVFVMMTGSALSFDPSCADAILNTWYGGEFAGKAVADIVFGNYNPSGRLPVTFYKHDSDLPDFEDYNMQNRTYRYFRGETLYPFGYGLNFSKFSYTWSQQPKQTYSIKDKIHCSIQIRNDGPWAGDEVAQLYIQYPDGFGYPLKELRGFERVSIQAGEQQTIGFTIPVADLQKWNEDLGKLDIVKGNYTISIGNHSDNKAVFTQFKIE